MQISVCKQLTIADIPKNTYECCSKIIAALACELASSVVIAGLDRRKNRSVLTCRSVLY